MPKFKNIITITLGFVCGIVFTATCTVGFDTALSPIDTAGITTTTATAGAGAYRSRAVVEINIEHFHAAFDPTAQTLSFVNGGASCVIEGPKDSGWIDYSNCCPSGFTVVSVNGHFTSGHNGWNAPDYGGHVTCLENL